MAVDISPKQDGGVLKEILNEGVGVDLPPIGCKVKVHYTGTLTDGTKFDSSRDRNEPFEFDLGKGSVIKAWDIGVATMTKGERAMLTCASDYAYGPNGSPPTIPPDATLKFDVEVLDWRGEDLSPKNDGGIERVQIQAGEGVSTPNDGAVVTIHLIGKYEDKIFDDRDVTFTIGEGSEENIVRGVERALEKFKMGEKSRLIIKPQYAFGAEGSATLGVPPNATVEFEITLKNFEKAPNTWSMDAAQKVAQAKLFKERGTQYFKSAKYKLAIKLYKKIVELFEKEKESEELGAEITALNLSAHLNLSLAQLNLQNYFEARKDASAALAIDPKNEKALYRRGQALIQLREPALAKKDFVECLAINPENKAAQSQLIVCANEMKKLLQSERKIYANMFDKFAKMDTQREEIEKNRLPNVLSSVGEWGQEDREREPSEFEKENPNILMLNGSGEFKDM